MTLRRSAILLPAFLTWGCSSAPTAPFADDLVDAGLDAAPVYIPPPAWSGGSPVLIAKSEEAISLALDDAHVYWQAAGGSVFECPLGGCPGGMPTQLSSLIGPTSAALHALGADGGTAVFLSENGNSITSVTTSGPARASTIFTIAAGSLLGGLVSDGSRVYFADDLVSTCYSSTESLFACPLGGPCASPEALYQSRSAYGLGPLFVAGSEIFFVEDDDSADVVRAVSTGGGPSRKVCNVGEDYGGVTDIAVAGGFVYMTTSENPRSIAACAAAGSGSSNAWTYVEDLEPYALATDGANLYWTNYQAEGSVVTCALGKECTTPFTVASNQESPFAIAANGSSVFWSTPSSIFRADK
jgi:hypothetical protein